MTPVMSTANLLDPITADAGETRFSGLDHWMQGRTLYGGASALIAYTAVTRAFPDLPPLRGAQIAFVAPTGPEMELAPGDRAAGAQRRAGPQRDLVRGRPAR